MTAPTSGVVGLYFIPDSLSPNAYQHLTDRLTKVHHPLPLPPWKIEHRLLRSAVPTSPDFLQHLDAPHISPAPFVVCGQSIITCDRDFLLILKTKLASLWSHRQTIKVEGAGFEVEDWRIRIGRLGDKGTVVEVEFTAANMLEQAEKVGREVVEGLGVPGGRWTWEKERGEVWTVMDTGRVWAECLRMRNT
ncbi:mediator complex, subunit Med20 [Pyronema omphalodes]|nr:mediator complex, subunit Med20 [Pyronema omphalodes]